MTLRTIMWVAWMALVGCVPPRTTPSVEPPVVEQPDASVDAGVDAGAPAFISFPSLVSGDHAVLFVGNSYVAVNDLPAQYRGVFVGDVLRTEAVATGGYRLSDHASEAQTDGTPIAKWLRTGTPAETAWDAVVLQDQSQVPGLGATDPSYLSSLEGVATLGALARAKGAGVVLFVTWGRERGDGAYPTRYPDFLTMQQHLNEGYRGFAARLQADGVRVRLAPVGPAFARVHAAAAASGDPTTEGSVFDALYDPDGSHPSFLGSYLAACVIASTITGEDPETFPIPAHLPADEARKLRTIAHEVLEDPNWAPE